MGYHSIVATFKHESNCIFHTTEWRRVRAGLRLCRLRPDQVVAGRARPGRPAVRHPGRLQAAQSTDVRVHRRLCGQAGGNTDLQGGHEPRG